MRPLTSLMSELRWALLLLGIVFIALLAFWERRRPRQASPRAGERATREGLAEPTRPPREPTLTLPEMRAREPLVRRDLPVVEIPDPPTVPFRAAAGEGPQELPGEFAEEFPGEFPAAPPEASPEELAAPQPPTASPAPSPGHEPQAAAGVPALSREVLPELPPPPPLVVEWPPDDSRRIVALRLVATNSERFAGRSLRQALAAEGFVLGQFAIFHKPDDERRAVLSAASLTRPGTFDMDTMDSQHYGGLSLFAVLPGPKAPPQTFDELVVTARSLNDRLHGVLQDEQGSPLTPARIASLRERLAAAS